VVPGVNDTATNVWVTGAGKGIGRALAQKLARDGWTVAASARTTDDLTSLSDEVAGGPGAVAAYPLDVTKRDDVAETFDRIEAELGQLDLVVLNVGTHMPVRAREFDADKVRSLLETNLMGTVHCLEAIMPRFIQRTSGKIAVVSSVAGYRGLPTAAAYGATKAALINMCEALKPELDRAGVTLQLVCPGFVDTPLSRKNTFTMPFLISADDAAEAIAKGLRSNRFEIVFPWRMALAMKVLRILPNRILFAITRRMVGDGE